MKKNRTLSIFFIVTAVLAAWLAGCRDGVSSRNDENEIEAPPGYRLFWNDEFTGSSINPEKWEHEVNAQGGGNNELQYYTARPENSRVEDGYLIITARSEVYTAAEGTREYTSARLRTRYKGDWTYGRFDIRARMPRGQGLWPAIWMLPSDWVYGGWAASGEIDIMELLGHEPAKVHGTIHYGGAYPANTQSGGSYIWPEPLSDDFHTYSIEWDTTSIRWYIDGINYYNRTSWYSSGGPYPAPFDQRFHLLLNVAVGGNWPGSPDETTVFPQEMTVDWVRVFQKDPR
ncbi:glycoside hydrolase family 16 protein [bacterium]|nr:glycoside hydrolase family 16 protein [bacterium]